MSEKSIFSQKPVWAQNLKKARKMARMTQREMADVLFKASCTYYLYEKGECEPSMDTWKIIWELFKIADPIKFWTEDYYELAE